MRRLAAILGIALFALVPAAASRGADDDPLSIVTRANGELAARGLHVGIADVDFFTIGENRPDIRLHQNDARFVPGDPRRGGRATLTYLVDASDGATASGLASAQTGGAIRRAIATWQADRCFGKMNLVENADSGADPDVLDGLVGYGEVAEPGAADVVYGGWLPRGFFELLGGPGGGRGILGMTVTFTFVDDADNSTDIDGDHYDDIAFVETYFNDNFGNPGGDRTRNPWQIDGVLPAIDVESVALHESGHAFGLGHFGPPPVAVMNPRYVGLLHELQPADHAGMCTVWSSWPARSRR